MTGAGACVCVLGGGYGAAGGFHVPLPPARRLGQTSVKHTHPHTLHLPLSLTYTPTQHLRLLLGYALLSVSHTDTCASSFLDVCVRSHICTNFNG